MKNTIIVIVGISTLFGAPLAHAKKKKIPTVAEAKKTCLAADPTITGTALGECIKKEKRGAAVRSK